MPPHPRAGRGGLRAGGGGACGVAAPLESTRISLVFEAGSALFTLAGHAKGQGDWALAWRTAWVGGGLAFAVCEAVGLAVAALALAMIGPAAAGLGLTPYGALAAAGMRERAGWRRGRQRARHASFVHGTLAPCPVWRDRRRMIIVTHWVEPEVLGRLSAAAPVEANPTRESWPPAELARRAARATAMLGFMPDVVDEPFLVAAPRLRVLACALKGFDNFDVEACTRRGVWVSIVPDLLTEPTAELALGLAIGLGRHIRAGDARVREGRFAGWRPVLYGRGLAGAAVGIVGFGAVGRAVEARLAGFGCAAIRHHDPASPASVPLDALLALSDLIFCCAPLTPATRHLLGAERLARLRPGALLVNVGRGSVVDERAVLDVLDRGRLGGYAADVFAFEDAALPDRPREIAPALRRHPRTLWTPHLGSAVREVRRAIAERAADNILDWYAGQPPRDAVNAPPA